MLEVARELFAVHGYHDVTISEIARAASVTHGLIHAHFHSKAGLLFAILSENNNTQEAAARSVAESAGPFADRLRKVIEIYVMGDLQDRELLCVMQAFSWEWPYDFEAQNRVQLEATLEPLQALIEEASVAGELAASFEVERAVASIFAIYTQNLRQAVFDAAAAEACVDEIMASLTLLINGLKYGT